MDPETNGVMTVITDQILYSSSWEMYPATVYQGTFSLIAMYGDGDPDVTEAGKAKVECQVPRIVADAIEADSHTHSIKTAWVAY